MKAFGGELAITAKRLGIVLLAIYCARCLWYLLRLDFHPPNADFGGAIFKDLEKMQKAVVGAYLARDGELPKEFAPFCNITSRVDYPHHWSKFAYRHKSGVWIYGEPDDIFAESDGRLCVVDHKSAHERGDDDEFLPQYKIQTIGYANIAEVGLELGTVARGGLWYWDVQRDDVLKEPLKFVKDGRLRPPFLVKPVEVEIDYSLLDPLLKEVKKLWKAATPPECREGGCKHCVRRDALFAIEDSILVADQETYGHIPYLRDSVAQRYFTRRHAWYSALTNPASDGQDQIDMLTAWNL